VWLWVEMTVSLVRDATSAPVYFIAVVQNIDDRKQAESGLARTTQLLQTLVQESPLPIVSLDLQARVTSWNQAATRLFGWTEEEVLGCELPYVPEEEVESSNLLWKRGLQGEVRGPIELRRRRKDGRMLDLLLWPVFVQSDKGDVSTAIGLFVDQSDLKRAEEALQASESAIRELYDITSRKAAPFDQQIRELLDLGRRRFQLPIAAFMTVKGEQLELTAIRTDRPMPEEGALLPQCHICTETLKRNGTLAIERVGNSEWNDDSSCFLLGFESYLGTSLSVGGQRFGAICFMDEEPYRGYFSEPDKDFLLLMARWITRELERQKAERALQEQEALLRSVIETATDAIFMKDDKGRYRFINTAGALVIGQSSEAIVGKTDAELLPLETAQQIIADDQQVLTEGAQQRKFETLFPGEARAQTFYTVKTPHTDHLGNIVGLVGIARDMTDLKRAETELRNSEEALRASEERFSKAFRSSPYPIGITDLETGVCLDINDAALAAFGYTREEVIGQTTSVLGIWPDAQARRHFIEHLKINGSVRNLETTLKSKHGEVRRFLASTEVIVLKGKECLVTIGTDITEQKRAEVALRRSELAVREAFEERERLSQDLHDNLLQSLYAVGMGLELTKQRIQRISRANAKRLEQSVGQLNHVIREVRSFISHVQPPLVLDEQTMADALRVLAGSFMSTGAGEIVVAVDDEAGLRLSAEQRTHLLAIAKEALSNSIRHTKADKRVVSLRRHGNKIRLEVTDNGHGFSPAQRRMQGMGLQNMRARARKLRGRITISSVLMQGTTVSLTIPST
jgi:PAS domain S-box-containing protein